MTNRPLTIAASRFVTLKAAPLLDRCNDNLATADLQIPWHSPPRAGTDDREATRELFISQKTDEYHLSHV